MSRDVITEALEALRTEHAQIGAAIEALEKVRGDGNGNGKAAAPAVEMHHARQAPRVSQRTIKQLAQKPGGDMAAPRKRGLQGEIIATVREALSAHRTPFTVRDVVDSCKDLGRPVDQATVRAYLQLLVDAGEIYVEHEGNGTRWDPTRWAKGPKA